MTDKPTNDAGDKTIRQAGLLGGLTREKVPAKRVVLPVKAREPSRVTRPRDPDKRLL